MPLEMEEGIRTIPKGEIFPYPFRNFGRMDGISRMTACAIALALQDAGLGFSPGNKQDTGIAGTGPEGSLSSDLAYFRDYLENGRRLSRGNLFVYTLPSSPLGESAIYFGLTGPLLYVTGTDGSIARPLEVAAGIVRSGEAGRMLAGSAGEEEAVYFLLDGDDGGNPLFSLADILPLVDAGGDTTELLHRISLKIRKG